MDAGLSFVQHLGTVAKTADRNHGNALAVQASCAREG